MILYIDTTNIETTTLELFSDQGEILASQEHSTRLSQSEKLLTLIDELLEQNKINKNILTAIAVNNGPGSYTGVRIGVTTANSLAFALNIPVIGLENPKAKEELLLSLPKNSLSAAFGKYVIPIYANAPHITTPKKS